MELMLKTLASIWIAGSLYINLVFRSQFLNGDRNEKPLLFLVMVSRKQAILHLWQWGKRCQVSRKLIFSQTGYCKYRVPGMMLCSLLLVDYVELYSQDGWNCPSFLLGPTPLCPNYTSEPNSCTGIGTCAKGAQIIEQCCVSLDHHLVPSFKCVDRSQVKHCTLFVWDRISFLQNNLYGSMFWTCDQNSVDDTEIFNCCWAVLAQHPALFCFSQSPTRE